MNFASWSSNGGNAAYQNAVMTLLSLGQIPAASVSSVTSAATLAAPALVTVHGRELQGGGGNGVLVSTTILTAPGSSRGALNVLGGGGGASPILQAMQDAPSGSRWDSLRAQAIFLPTTQPSAKPTAAPVAAAGANSGGSASSTTGGSQTTIIAVVVVVVVVILAALGYMVHARLKNNEHPALSFSEQYMGNQRDSFQGSSPAFEPRRSSNSSPQRHGSDMHQQQQQQQQTRNSLRSSVGRPSEGRQSIRLSVEARVPGSQGGPRRPSIAHLAHNSVAPQRSPFHGNEFDEL
jgi:type II secretory pathway pseudopilin PulG